MITDHNQEQLESRMDHSKVLKLSSEGVDGINRVGE